MAKDSQLRDYLEVYSLSSDQDGKTALTYAARWGYLEICKLLLEKGADVNLKDQDGYTAMLLAAKNGHIEIVKMAIEHGSDINGASNHGSTALLLAAEYGHINIVAMVIEQGAHIGIEDNDGDTALICAAIGGHTDICQYLCNQHADVNIKNKNGKTAEDMALERGHPLTAKFLEKIRHEIEVAKIGESGNYIEENDIPIKMFIAGPPQAGKTTLVRSVFDHESDANSFWNEKYICEDHKERTICLTQHYKRLFSNLPLLIYDLGGQECYYALHAVFLDLEDSFFLILVDISKEDYVLKESIKSQLSIISSKLRLHSKAEVLFIGTHADMLDEKQKREKINICKKTLMEAKNTYHNISIFRKKMYINATSKDSKELQEITIACEQLGNNVHKAMGEHKRKIPKFVMSVYEDLKKTSERLEKEVLNWEIVSKCVRDSVRKQGIQQDLTGENVHQICSFLKDLGMVLFASAGGFNVDPSAYDKKDFTAYIIPNLNWLLSKFLGPLFSPTGFLNDPDICKDGYVSTDYLEEAFEEFDLERQELLHILDYYKLIVEQVDENHQTHYLIPAALQNEKNNEWMSWEEEDCPYLFMMGRKCCSNMGINPITLTKVLHSVKKEFPEEKIHYFQGGCYIKTQSAHILIEPVSHRGIQVKLGIRKDRVGNSKEEVESIIKEGMKLFEKVFIKVGCTSMEEANPSAPLERWVLSLEGMKEKDDKVYYKLADVQKHFDNGKKFIDSDTKRGDTTSLLLTWMEMSKERQKIMDNHIAEYVNKSCPNLPEKSKKDEVMATPDEKQHGNPGITHKAVREDRKKNNEYTMERKPRGKCVIINNEKFETMDNRSGTEFDAENLQKTFTWLQFDVDIFNDCTADSICKHIDEYSKMKHNDYQCFVLCILSHGSSEGVFGTDGECVSMKFIRQSFVGDECQTLHGKPKIFLIQACRGSEVDQGKFFRPDTSLSPDGSRPAPKLLAVDTDLVLAYATTPGYRSWRSHKTGSWFINILCEVLQERAHESDLMSMLTEVNGKLTQIRGEVEGETVMQTCEFTNTLRKSLYFNPDKMWSEYKS